MASVWIGVRARDGRRTWWLWWWDFFGERSLISSTTELGGAGSVRLDLCAGEDAEDCDPF